MTAIYDPINRIGCNFMHETNVCTVAIRAIIWGIFTDVCLTLNIWIELMLSRYILQVFIPRKSNYSDSFLIEMCSKPVTYSGLKKSFIVLQTTSFNASSWMEISKLLLKFQLRSYEFTVYPKKYAHGFCFAVLCCGYTLTDFPISITLTSLALWQSNDCPSASKAPLMNMDKYFMWIHYERLHNHNKAKHNKTVCIFLGIYCSCQQVTIGSGNCLVLSRRQPIICTNENYSISQEICTRFCCGLLCCGYAIAHNEFTWSIYPYSSGLLYWHWGNR